MNASEKMLRITVKDLENKGIRQILLFLQEHGKTKITDFKIDVAQSTLYHALKILSDAELIEEERVPPVTRYIKLTPDGEKVAKLELQIKKILDDKIEREIKRDHQ